MKLVKKTLILAVSLSILLAALYFLWLSPRYVVPILMYHRFGYDAGNSLFVTPENFFRQMSYLKTKGYDVIALDELVMGIENNKRFKHKTVVITVDDGHQDSYTYAYPILKEHGFPATIFIIANYIDNEEYFLTWEQIKAMSGNNISFGGHTKNEVYLPSIENSEILWDETAGCKQMIESMAGIPVDYFCYPTGGFTEQIKELLKKAGYKGACTTNRGLIGLNKDVYELKRIKVTNSDMTKPFNFWVKLTGYYNLFRRKRMGHSRDKHNNP